MSTIRRHAFAAVLGVVCCAAPARPAAGQTAPYRFDLLSERTGFAQGTNLIRSLPALNDNGIAAFILGEPTAYYGHALYTGTPGALTRVETPGVSVGGGVSINNHGRMGFIGIATGTTFPDVFAVSAGGPIVPISNGASFGSFDPDAGGRLETAISDSGAVMALADQPQRFPSSVVVGDGTGPAQAVFRTSPPFGGAGGAVELTSPRMSATGDWTAHEINSGPPAFSAVHSSRGSQNTALLQWSGLGTSDVAADGVVVFQGTPTGGARALYTYGGNTGGPRIVPGSATLPGGTVALNDAGDIALLAGQLAGSGTRLLLLRNGVTDTVLSAGDPLLGSTVSTIGFDPKGFNNSARFALLVGLADGRDVFVLASPAPEPHALALALGTGLFLPRRRR
jgi:hypothetical protein